jgi:hypothetical protein
MVSTQDDNASSQFFELVIKQEDEYRRMLTKEQLEAYRKKLNELETNDPKLSDSYSALYFSDKLLNEYKAKL